MHHLLVAIDGSDSAARGLQYALGLAREIGGVELHLVTVFPEPTIYGEIEVYVPVEKMRAMQTEHAEEILAPAVEAVKSSGVRHTSEIIIGDVARSLLQTAERRRCDGIVMGRKGTSSIADLLMGSVAMKVVHLTKIPVTLVP